MNPQSEIQVRILEKPEPIPYALLLLADPSLEMIDAYLQNAVIYIAELQKETIGVYVLFSTGPETAEIKNIAVEPVHQGKGVGKMLLEHAAQMAKASGCNTLLIGTADSSISQLSLYQKAGFKITGLKKDFFSHNYDQPIYENGVQCKDMVILSKGLNSSY